MKAKKFADSVTIRLPAGDLSELRRISTSLALDQAEVCRRAVRIGLGELREVRLPGGSDQTRESRR